MEAEPQQMWMNQQKTWGIALQQHRQSSLANDNPYL
jgi:hypothetical protein